MFKFKSVYDMISGSLLPTLQYNVCLLWYDMISGSLLPTLQYSVYANIKLAKVDDSALCIYVGEIT